MAISLKPLNEQVIVITGASSGIGLTTARDAAKKGAKVVLASRSKETLQEVEEQIKNEGGQAIHVVADVGKREDVQKIADAAIKEFGRFDTSVNDVGVSIYGKLEEVSDEDHRKLFETNFWGVVYGSLVAAEHLKGRGGAIINIGSVLSDVAIPIQGMYSASKHAVKGFTDALRTELETDDSGISVTLIKPAAINTPYVQHAKNYTGKAITLPPPVYAPEEVSNAILSAATSQYRDIFVGSGGKMMSSINKYAPGLMDWVSENIMSKQEVRDEPAQHREGGLQQSGEGGKMHGDYKGHVMKKSFYTRAATNPVLTGTVAAAAGAVAVALLGNKSRNKKKHKLRW